jgi:hypothetical protein
MSVADQIIVHGHTKGTLMNSSGNVCLTGAALLDAGYDLNFDYLESDKAYEFAYRNPAMKRYTDAFAKAMGLEGAWGQEWVWERVFSHNDNEHITEADALRLAKMVDEELDK